MAENSETEVQNIFVHLLCIIIMFMSNQILLAFTPFKRGFYCNDESISYPWKLNVEISSTLLFVISCTLVIPIVFLNNWYQHDSSKSSTVYSYDYKVPRWRLKTCSEVFAFIFGGGATKSIVSFGKLWLGRLTPNFMQMCLPDVDCTETKNQHVYIQNFNCTNKSIHPSYIDAARLSFPSRHSTTAAYTMIYLILYLRLRCRFKGCEFYRLCLQIICLMIVCYEAAEQLWTYAHHPSDVLAGIVLGAIVALVVIFHNTDLNHDNHNTEEMIVKNKC